MSDWTVRNAIDELSMDSVFASLSQAQQIQILNSVSQSISVLYNAKGKSDYRGDNLSGIPGVISGGTFQSGVVQNVTTAGTTVAFSTPFTHAVISDGDYTENVVARRTEDGSLVTIGCKVVRAPGSLTMIPDFTADYIVWSVVPFTQ